MKSVIIILLILLLSVPLFGCSLSTKEKKDSINNKSSSITVNISENPDLGDYVFTSTHNNCTINWYVFEPITPQSKKYLEVRYNECQNPSFDTTKDTNRAILNEILNKWEIDDFSSFSGVPTLHDNDDTWCIPLAITSVNSEEYQDYKNNYPNSRITSINSIYVQIANEAKLYEYNNELFNEFGAEITLESAEKVGSKKVSDLPCKEKLMEMGISENERVLHDAQKTYFKINTQNSSEKKSRSNF